MYNVFYMTKLNKLYINNKEIYKYDHFKLGVS